MIRIDKFLYGTCAAMSVFSAIGFLYTDCKPHCLIIAIVLAYLASVIKKW